MKAICQHSRMKRVAVAALASFALATVLATTLSAGTQPPPDLRRASAGLVPTGAVVLFTQELDARVGIVTYRRDGSVAALGALWSHGAWRIVQTPGLAAELLVPANGLARIEPPTLLTVRFRAPRAGLGGHLWLDGRELRSVGWPDGRTETSYYSLAGVRRGQHVLTALVTTDSGLRGRAWKLTVQ